VAVAPPPPAPPPPVAAAPERAEAKPAAPADLPKAAAAGEGEVGAGKPRTYEQLVADADHALENGHTAKAQKLYDEALKLQPDGVAAVTGSAYLLLDRQRTLAAIGLFKRALTNAPGFAPALFGLGEAYRSQGNSAGAIDYYKRYLDADPNGADAPAARRQVRELGEAAEASARRAESAKADPVPGPPPASDQKTP
jgi:tetratricopeptide (TPR) repeat protein